MYEHVKVVNGARVGYHVLMLSRLTLQTRVIGELLIAFVLNVASGTF